MQRFFSDLTYEGFFKRNPFYAINFDNAAEGKSAREKVMNIDNYKILIKYLNDKGINEATVYDLALQTPLLTGLRVSEMIDLKLDDLNFEDSTIKVDSNYSRLIHGSKSPKTKNSYRVIRVSGTLMNEISSWLSLNNIVKSNERIFRNKLGNALNLNSVNYYFHKIQTDVLEISKVEHISTHSMRHTFASYLLSPEGGEHSVQFIADMLGDTQSTVQDVYLHLLEDEKIAGSKEIVSMFDSMLISS